MDNDESCPKLKFPVHLRSTRRVSDSILSTYPSSPFAPMPSLADTLAHLHAQSEQIVHLSAHNYRSSGPFAQAYLGTPDVLSLIRDADPSESRLFKFIGEESSGNKKVEKRDGGVVTPLKEFKKRPVDAVEGVGVMLKTAMTLVED